MHTPDRTTSDGLDASWSISSVDCYARTVDLGICCLACQDGSHWLALSFVIAQHCKAKIRPLSMGPDLAIHPDDLSEPQLHAALPQHPMSHRPALRRCPGQLVKREHQDQKSPSSLAISKARRTAWA